MFCLKTVLVMQNLEDMKDQQQLVMTEYGGEGGEVGAALVQRPFYNASAVFSGIPPDACEPLPHRFGVS